METVQIAALVAAFFILSLDAELSDAVTLDDGGYFVKVMELPAVCPLTSFCIPWRPVPSEVSDPRRIHLLHTPALVLSVGGLHLPWPRGSLRSTYDCARMIRGKGVRIGDEGTWKGAWCLLEPISGTVRCWAKGKQQPNFRFGRASRHVYVIPKRCVSWKSDYKTQRVFTRRVAAAVRLEGAEVRLEFGRDGVMVRNGTYEEDEEFDGSWGERYAGGSDGPCKNPDGDNGCLDDVFSSKNNSDDDDDEGRLIGWSSRGERVAFDDIGLVVEVGKSSATVVAENLTSFRVQRASSSYANQHLELLVDYLDPNWLDSINSNYPLVSLVNQDLGLMWRSGLLQALQWTPTASPNGSMTGLCPSRLSNPYCECRYLRQETAPAESSDDGGGMGSPWWQQIPLQLRTQSCCDLLLGKLNYTTMSKKKVSDGVSELAVTVMSSVPGRFLYFSDGLPCPRGARLLDDDGACAKQPCCDRTQLQVAEWDHRERGRCWVLKSGRGASSSSDSSESSTTIRVSVSAAYGIIGLTTVFVLSFRLVTRKLDECRRKTGRLPP